MRNASEVSQRGRPRDICIAARDALPPAIFGKFKTEPALADSGFPGNTDHPAFTRNGIGEFDLEGGELVASSDQGS